MNHDRLPAPEAVKTREEFAGFVDAMRADLAVHPDDWENPTLDRFLEAFSAYVRDAPGYLRNVQSPLDPEMPRWELFALMLAGARSYE